MDLVEETLERTQHSGRTPQNGRLLPKTEPLRGSLHAELKRCGKPTCHCVRGVPHGPYWSLRWREGGHQLRRYVRPGDVAHVQANLDQWRQLHPPVRAIRARLSELRRLLRELDGED
jgi:Family of unknown function (DUF6788)